ncbi:MAG: sulfite exporter TauE/SafE family protein [Neobacillus sp.]
MWELIFVAFILFIGSSIQGASGFGFGLFSMGLLPILLSLKDSTLLVLALTVLISLQVAIKFRKYIQIKALLFIVGAALTGRVVSFFFLNSFGDLDSMKKLLGFILIGMIIYLHVSDGRPTTLSVKKPLFAIIVGFIGGIIGGVFAVGGPFFVFYFLMRYTDKISYNANLQAAFVIMNVFTILLHGLNGDLNHHLLPYLLLGGIAVFMGVNLGLRWFERLPRERIKKLASVIVFISGLNLLLFS